MKIEIEIQDALMPALELVQKHTGMTLEEVINRSIVTGLQTLDAQLQFAKIHNHNMVAGIEPNKEIQ
jgi:hypothetical protein